MKILPRSNTIYKSLLLYRMIRYRKGHGVHSPFVFGLITKVIDVSHQFYCQKDIENTRKKSHTINQKILLRKKQNPGKFEEYTIGKVVKKEAITPRRGALLLRLTNYFKPKSILQIGVSSGISSLYLSSYTSSLNFTVLEKSPEMALVAERVFEEHNRQKIDVKVADYKDSLPAILKDDYLLDFVFINIANDVAENEYVFNQIVNHLHDSSVVVISGIKASAGMRSFWKKIIEHQDITVTVDLYSMGLIFFKKKLHKRNYIVSF